MAWTFSSDRPVYLQISTRITKKILSAEFKAGEQLPSVRQLALEAAVNPNTVQRAFSELENDGLIVSKGTVGRYVTENTEIIEKARHKTAEKIVKHFLSDMAELSIEKEQIFALVKEMDI